MMDTGLYEKYQVPENQSRAPLTPLSFILRKAEMSLHLTVEEWRWLEKRQLVDVINVIKSQENYRRTLAEQIRDEVLQLRRGKFVSHNILTIPDANSERTLVLYKVHNLEELDQDEHKFVDASYKEYCRFAGLKTRLGIIEEIPLCETSWRILSLMADGNNLASTDLEYLKERNIFSAFDSSSPFFMRLCEKYRLSPSAFSSQTKSQVYVVLQKLEENKLVTEAEQQVLEETDCADALEVAKTIELSLLKEKFHATQIEDNSPKQHLYKVLKKLEAGSPLPEADLNYLNKRKLHDAVVLELKRKIERENGFTQKEIAWCKQNGQEDMVFLWLKHDFDVEHRKDKLDSPLYLILQKLKAGQRLDDQEILWLHAEKWCSRKEEYYENLSWKKGNQKNIYCTHHKLEALFCEDEFKRTKNHWLLASGSAHWRKAEEPMRALGLTELDITQLKEAKLRQALLTTRGGALRDLGRLQEAELCALDAIKHYSRSHNPYTLMGALCFETRRYDEGYRWFEEARKRGATEKDENAEIKRILSTKQDRDLVEFLLRKDPVRYDWVKRYKPSARRGA